MAKDKWRFLETPPEHAETLMHRAFHLDPDRHPDHANGEATWYGEADGRLMLCFGDESAGYVWLIAEDAPDAEIHFLDPDVTLV